MNFEAAERKAVITISIVILTLICQLMIFEDYVIRVDTDELSANIPVELEKVKIDLN